MRQFGAWVWVALTSILVLVIIVWIVQWVLSKTNVWKDKLSFSRKERIKSRQIRKELKEKKETIINPNA
jgi:heme exporter protein D